MTDICDFARGVLKEAIYEGRPIFPDEEIGQIVELASPAALEGLVRGVPVFEIQELGWVRVNYGADVIKVMFKDYVQGNPELETSELLNQARSTLFREKYRGMNPNLGRLGSAAA